jgi:tRNA nucleotidyltransferase (CCA-adding enzyme)
MQLKSLDFPLKHFFIDVFKDRVYLVGGTVRDHLLYGNAAVHRDIDLMVTGCTYGQIERKLKKYGKTNTVGRSFAVVKFTKDERTFDIAVPRKDKKKDPDSHGHKNFIIDYGPHIPLEDDLGRRDFTCNSIAMRLIDDKLVDPFNGVKAVEEKRIVMTGPETFADDPLRVLRAARFASVHRFTIDDAIYMCSKDVRLDQLSKERITEELFRLLLESERPAVGMNEYFRLTVLEKLFPPFYSMSLTIQDAIFHPEQDEYGHHTVWHHVLVTLDIAKKLSVIYKLDEEHTLALLLGVLFHDVGKPETTRWEYKRGRMTVTSMFHDSHGVAIADKMLTELKVESRKGFPLKQAVLNLTKAHLRIYELYRVRKEIGYKAFSRLIRDMEGQDFLLVLLDYADRRSREPDPLDFNEMDDVTKWFLQRKEELNVDKETIQPIIMGRHLLKSGVEPGVQMGVYLKQLYERQLDGEFDNIEDGLKVFEKIRGKEHKH